jgi:hypothetical protein
MSRVYDEGIYNIPLDSSNDSQEFTEYDGTDPMYIGNKAANGSWTIEKYSSSAKTMRYCVGMQDYATNWTNRATLTYSLPSEV